MAKEYDLDAETKRLNAVQHGIAPRSWEEICDLITISANFVQRDIAKSGNPFDAMRAERDFLKNIKDYCENEADNIEAMMDDLLDKMGGPT